MRQRFTINAPIRLINLLAGRLNMTSMEGQVLIEAQSQPDNFKFTTGYVSQVI